MSVRSFSPDMLSICPIVRCRFSAIGGLAFCIVCRYALKTLRGLILATKAVAASAGTAASSAAESGSTDANRMSPRGSPSSATRVRRRHAFSFKPVTETSVSTLPSPRASNMAAACGGAIGGRCPEWL